MKFKNKIIIIINYSYFNLKINNKYRLYNIVYKILLFLLINYIM